MKMVWAALLLPISLLASFDSAAVDAAVAEAMRASGVPGAAVAIVRRDGPVLVKAYGVKRAGSHDPVTPQSLFAIGSLTKAFTCTAIAIGVDEGVVQWDDPVRRHLPWFRLHDPLAEKAATLRDLATHRTGMAGNDLLWTNAPWTLDESVRRLGRVEPSASFRARYQYQNILYNAAGLALAAAYKTTYRDFLERRILKPLGMNGTVFTSVAARQAKDAATPHNGDAKPIEWYFDEHQIRPAGSLKMGIADLTRWMRFHLGDGTFEGKRLLSTARLRELHTPQIVLPSDPPEALSSYALGWVVENYRGHLALSHGGGTVGFRTQLTVFPKDDYAVAVFTNQEDTWFQDALVLTLSDLVLNLPKKDWNAEISTGFKQQLDAMSAQVKEREAARRKGTKPSLPLADYAGTFTNAAYGAVRIDPDAVLWWSGFRLPLKHYHYDVFDVTGDKRVGAQASFHIAPSGVAAQLHWLGQVFQRVTPPARDNAAIADRLVKALKLAPGERVLIRAHANEFPGLAAELTRRIPNARTISDADPLPALDATDVFLWLPLGETGRQFTAAERASLAAWLDRGGRRRQIHFHWSEGSRRIDGLPAPHTAELDAMYTRALDIDYAALAAAQDRIIAKLRRATVRINTPAGTDIMFRTGVRTFNRQDGDASGERAAKATMRIDREIEYPAGVVRVAPIEESAHGVLVLPEMWAGDQLARKVAIFFDNGRITRIRAETNQEAVEAYIKANGEPATWFREFALGLNPKLSSPDNGLTIPYYGYGDGTVRISLGDNTELGGKVRGGFTRWFFLPDASVHIDNRYIVRNGKLVE